MKKYTVYFMSLLVFAAILNGNLQGAAAPESAVEYEGKELAAAMADPKKVAEVYTKLTQQVLYEQYKVRQCRINRTCSQKMAEAQESVWDILYGDENVHEKALDFRRIESHGETTIKSIAILSEDVKNLKQRFAQENKGSWWGWLTTKKQVITQPVSSADINNLIKEGNALKEEYDKCNKARNKSIRKIEKYNTLFAEKISQKVTNPQQLLQQQKMLRYLKDLISKIDQMNKLMLEKDKLEWQLRLLAFTRGRAALQEEQRIQQLSRTSVAVGKPVEGEPEIKEQHDEPVGPEEPEEPGEEEEKVYVSREEERRRQEQQRLQAGATQAQEQEVKERAMQEAREQQVFAQAGNQASPISSLAAQRAGLQDELDETTSAYGKCMVTQKIYDKEIAAQKKYLDFLQKVSWGGDLSTLALSINKEVQASIEAHTTETRVLKDGMQQLKQAIETQKAKWERHKAWVGAQPRGARPRREAVASRRKPLETAVLSEKLSKIKSEYRWCKEITESRKEEIEENLNKIEEHYREASISWFQKTKPNRYAQGSTKVLESIDASFRALFRIIKSMHYLALQKYDLERRLEQVPTTY